MKKLNPLFAGLLFLVSLPAAAEIKVFACEPEWAALVQELGGDKVSVFTATTARQDPHHIEARPSLIARLRRADLLVCTGAELEIGWLPVVLRQSGNSAVQPGRPGYFEAANHVQKLEIPARWIALKAMCMPRATRTSRPIHATSAPWPRRWFDAWPRLSRPAPTIFRHAIGILRNAGMTRSGAGNNRPRGSGALASWCNTRAFPTWRAGWACGKSRRLNLNRAWNPPAGISSRCWKSFNANRRK